MRFAAVGSLRPNDKVAVIAPSGPFDRPSFDAGLAVLARRYQPVFTEGLFARSRYLAGDDARRATELVNALTTDDVRAVFTARGGYGLTRLLPALQNVTPRPLPVVGFSDGTALHAALERSALRSVHGPVLTQLGRAPAEVADRLFTLLESPAAPPPLTGTRCIVPGVVEGPLLGGNLSVLTRLVGTPFMPDVDGAVLLLEDVGERPYRLDRMWTHLQLAGVLDRVAGIAFGDFTGCDEKDADYGPLDVLAELARALGKPCAAGFTIGHADLNLPVVLGAHTRLDATAGVLQQLEGLVRE